MNCFYYIDNEEDMKDAIVDLMRSFPVYFQEPYRIEEIIRNIVTQINKTITIIVESEYIDRQYRDSYYSYFSQKYSGYNRNCMRLIFFEGEYSEKDFLGEMSIEMTEGLIGSIVLRPLKIGNIGLTLIDPRKFSIHGKGYIQTGKFNINVFGRKFKVRAFPFLSQDSDCMTCAETALYILMQYYGQKYSEYRIVMPSEILNITEEAYYQRVLPSEGMGDIYIAKVLSMEHFYPRLYEKDEDIQFLFHTYVESGIPFIFGLPQHAVVCVGHGEVDFKIKGTDLKNNVKKISLDNSQSCFLLNTSSMVKGYIFMDDNKCPYTVSSLENMVQEYYSKTMLDTDFEEDYYSTQDNSKEEYNKYKLPVGLSFNDIIHNHCALLVPLYKRIFLDANRARNIFDEVFLNSYHFTNSIRQAYNDTSWGMSIENPIVWRMYLASSNSYKEYKCRTVSKEDLALYYASNPFPRFIWVMELGTVHTFEDKCSRVEIILDATSSTNSSTWGILSIGYKGHHVFASSAVENKQVNVDLVDTFYDSSENSVHRKKMQEFNSNRDLTAVFIELYNGKSDLFTDTFKVFRNYNLKEI